MSESKVVRKNFISLSKKFQLKVSTIEENKKVGELDKSAENLQI